MTRAIPSRIAKTVEADNAKKMPEEWKVTFKKVMTEMEHREKNQTRTLVVFVVLFLAALLCATFVVSTHTATISEECPHDHDGADR